MRVVAVVSSLILTLLAVVIGMAKVQRLPASMSVRDQARVPAVVWTLSGWIELGAAATLVVGTFVALELALAAAVVLFICYLALAVRQLLQVRSVASAAPALILTALSAVVVASVIASG